MAAEAASGGEGQGRSARGGRRRACRPARCGRPRARRSVRGAEQGARGCESALDVPRRLATAEQQRQLAVSGAGAGDDRSGLRTEKKRERWVIPSALEVTRRSVLVLKLPGREKRRRKSFPQSHEREPILHVVGLAR